MFSVLVIRLRSLRFLFVSGRLTPLPTLFPYTTLFRSTLHGYSFIAGPVGGLSTCIALGYRQGFPRSEEHTSELQSQSNLVCRLQLEKKNFVWQLAAA